MGNDFYYLKTGSTITEYSFDAWGRRRDKDSWSYTLSSEPALFADRGFTGHEFLADFNLYNMNGRMYDPVVARFLSPDPYIIDPSFTQSYNRYSYCLNNPLKFTDPSGEFIFQLFAAWAGNYLIGVADNWINKDMTLTQAFKATPVVAGVNFSPSNQTFSHPQVSQQLIAKQEEILSHILDVTIAGFSGMGSFNNNEGNWAEIGWNSPVMRAIVPDRITIAIPDVNVAIIGGAGQNVEINWITRGKDANFLPYISNTRSRRWGVVGDIGMQLSVGWYPGPASEIQKDFLYGPTYNVDGGYIAGGNIFWALDKNGYPIWIGGGFGFGLTIGASYGKGYTSSGLNDPPRF